MANYAESLLASGERVVRREHQHWFILVANTRYAILALIACGAAHGRERLVRHQRRALAPRSACVTLVLFVYGIAAFLWGILRYRNEEYLITNRRLIHAEGVVNKKTTDSSLEKINDAVLTESMFGRMFGFGDLDVLTASEEGIERLRMLRDAKDFKKAMIEAKHELEIEVGAARSCRRSAPSRLPSPPHPSRRPRRRPRPLRPPRLSRPRTASNDIGAALDRLGDLRDRGLITPEEYAAKRQELLDRL